MLLELENVSASIGNREIVRDASVGFAAGDLTALVGANGSGKTTLLRLCAGLLTPDSGRVLLEGGDLQTMSRRRIARQIAFTPQDTHLDFRFTVRDTVAQGRYPHRGRFELETDADRASVEAAMELADVSHLASRYVTELSGGERQRVLVARSLATESDVILLDEPTANLDIRHALDALALLRRLAAAGKTIIIALHDLNHAARFATRIALIREGVIVASGAPDVVLDRAAIREVFGVDAHRAVTPDGETALLFRPLD